MLFSKSVFSLEIDCLYENFGMETSWLIEDNNFFIRIGERKKKWGVLFESELDYVASRSKIRQRENNKKYTLVTNIIINKKTLNSFLISFRSDDEELQLTRGTCKLTN